MEKEKFRMKKNIPKDLLGSIGGCGGIQAQHSKVPVEILSVCCFNVCGLVSIHCRQLKWVWSSYFSIEKVAQTIINFHLNVGFLFSSLMLPRASSEKKCATWFDDLSMQIWYRNICQCVIFLSSSTPPKLWLSGLSCLYSLSHFLLVPNFIVND